MVSEVILHIGMHKTGSTSIQTSLAGYDDGDTFYARFPEINHSAAIRGTFSKRPENYHQWKKLGLDHAEISRRRLHYRQQLDADLQRTDRSRLIISGEGIGLLEDDGKIELLEVLAQYSKRIRVVCYVRAPLAFAASYLQENIKVGRNTSPPVVPPEYRKRLELFAERLPAEDVMVRAFERQAFADGSVVADFCHLVGLDTQRVSETVTNESLSAPALKLLYAFNRSNCCYAGDVTIHQARQVLARWVQSAYASGPAIDAKRLYAKADFSEIGYLQARFGIEFKDAPEEKPETCVDYVDKWLLNLADVDLTPLRERLQQIGASCPHDASAAWMLSRLYYHLVTEVTVQRRRFRITPKNITLPILGDVITSFFIAAGHALQRRLGRRLHRKSMARQHQSRTSA